MKDTGNFLEKLKAVNGIPKWAILVTADVVGLYPNIAHDGGLKVIPKQYDKFRDKIVLIEDIIKMELLSFKIIFLNLIVDFNSKYQVLLFGP